MKKIVTLVAFFLIGALASEAYAEAELVIPPVGKDLPLVEMSPAPSVRKKLQKAGWEMCGKYFIRKKTPQPRDQIIFFGVVENDWPMIGGVYRDVFILSIDSSRAMKPTAVLLEAKGDDLLPYRWVVHMNSREARAARKCLPLGRDPRAM